MIPESVTSIVYGAFAECSALTSITIPESVTSIGHSAFVWCSALTSISIPHHLNVWFTLIGWSYTRRPDPTDLSAVAAALKADIAAQKKRMKMKAAIAELKKQRDELAEL